MLRRMHHHAGSALALALDVSAWAPSSAGLGVVPNSARPLLVRQGWRAVTLRPRDRLDLVWQDLGRTSAHAARAGGSGDEVRAGPAGGPVSGQPGDARRDLPLALVAAATTWVTMLSWRGFSTVWGGYVGTAVRGGSVRLGRRCGAARGAPAASRRACWSTCWSSACSSC